MFSLAGVAAAGVTAAAVTTLARRERTYLPRGHASRVDTCRDPLGRALRYGCAGFTLGVEVAPDGTLRVANGRAPAVARRAASGRGAAAAGAGTGTGGSGPGEEWLDPSTNLTLGDTPGDAASTAATAVAVADPAARSGSGVALGRLVLDPLYSRVRVTGRVHRAQHQPFSIVLEPVDGVAPADVLDALEDELDGYADMLTRCEGGTVHHAPVIVALAGVPRGILSERDNRLFFAEGTLADIDRRVPAAVIPLVAEHVAWRLGWDGRGDIPGEERHLLRALIGSAHAEGKRVRFFGVPEKRRAVRRAFWRELHAAGADLIGARDVGSLRRFLRAQRAHR